MGFSRQEYWSGLPWPPLGGLPDSGVEAVSPVSPALRENSLPVNHQGSPIAMTQGNNNNNNKTPNNESLAVRSLLPQHEKID